MRRALAAVMTTAALLAAAGCSSGGSSGSSVVIGGPEVTLRLGFVADVTQSTVLMGLRQKIFTQAIGLAVTLRTIPFTTDSAEAAALAAGKLDAAYASTGTILSTVRTKGVDFLRIISGTATGGAELVVKPGIGSPAALKGHTVAVPSADGPQAIALKYWLGRQHLVGTGNVTIAASTSAAATVQDFKSGRIDGAWLPAPYDVEMVQAGGRVLATEASIWPAGQFATTNLVVTRSYLNSHTSTVLSLLRAQVRANDALRENPLLVASAAAAEYHAVTGAAASLPLFASSMAQLTFTDDPVTTTFPTEAQRATALGIQPVTGNLASLYDLTPLNLILRMSGERPVL